MESTQTQSLVAEMERAERRSTDPRFSSALRAAAVQRAAQVRRSIERTAR
jgi:hypothetical protein